MTPYVVNEDSESPPIVPPAAPKSIMVNGEPPGQLDDKKAGTPESVASSSKSVPNGNGKLGKGTLKRVSFGSSKGSMVETLVYDHHQDEAPYMPQFTTPPIPHDGTPTNPPAKVRVSFFESQRPHFVSTPESPDVPFDFSSYLPIMSSPAADLKQQGDIGIDNPFRPDGELSREADTIVSLIKEGKPITPVKGEPDILIPPDGDTCPGKEVVDHVEEAPPSPAKEEEVIATKANEVECDKVGANGSAPKDTDNAEPNVVEVQHGVIVPPSDASQVEQVVIKKKPKCKCCVIQ